VLNLRLSK